MRKVTILKVRSNLIYPPTSFINNEDSNLRNNSYALFAKLDALINLDVNSQIEYVGRYSYGDFIENSSLQFQFD